MILINLSQLGDVYQVCIVDFLLGVANMISL